MDPILAAKVYPYQVIKYSTWRKLWDGITIASVAADQLYTGINAVCANEEEWAEQVGLFMALADGHNYRVDHFTAVGEEDLRSAGDRLKISQMAWRVLCRHYFKPALAYAESFFSRGSIFEPLAKLYSDPANLPSDPPKYGKDGDFDTPYAREYLSLLAQYCWREPTIDSLEYKKKRYPAAMLRLDKFLAEHRQDLLRWLWRMGELEIFLKKKKVGENVCLVVTDEDVATLKVLALRKSWENEEVYPKLQDALSAGSQAAQVYCVLCSERATW